MKILQWIKNHKIESGFFLLLALLGIPIIIHILFKLHSGIPFLEAEWTAGDFLSYYGAVLSFLGTAIISLVVVFIGHDFSEQSKRRQENRESQERLLQRLRQSEEREIQEWKLEEQRKQDIQPIFSVELIGVNVQPAGTADIFDIHNPDSMPKHENVKIRIKNVNSYPIFHVIIFEKYLVQMMEAGACLEIHCTYWNSIDAKKYGDKLIILTDDYEKDDMGRPKWFNINYEDIDGRTMYQGFELKTFDETVYYRLKETHEV